MTPAAAAPARAADPAVAGDISTVAGGSGGTDPGRNVGLGPCGVSFGSGSAYIGTGQVMYRLNPAGGQVTPLAGAKATDGPVGEGGPALDANINSSCGVAVDHHGNLVVADASNYQIQVVAHQTGFFYQQHMTAGDIYDVAGNGVDGNSDNGRLATAAEISSGYGVAVDAAGNLLIADTGNDEVRVVAESKGTFYGQAMLTGHIYAVAGTGFRGYGGDGGPDPRAMLDYPTGVAADGAGNLVIADGDNSRIRVVAGSTGNFYGQAMTAGDIYTVAGDGLIGVTGDGGPATAAALSTPAGATVDPAGNIVIADTDNNRIRVVAESNGTYYNVPMTAGDIYTVAGDGTTGYSGDGGPATGTELGFPAAVAVNSAGDLLIADQTSNRIREVSG
jgi:hypothetical protein